MSQTQASRVAVSQAIADYLNGAGVAYLSNVYPYPAKFTPEGELYESDDPGTQDGALIWMRLGTQKERREALQGAPAGGKFVYYALTMVIVFRSTKQLSQDAGYDNDVFLDSLLDAIRASKTAGTDDGTVWQWGEGTQLGGDDLNLEVFFPRPINNAVTQCNSRLDVTVVQWYSA